MTIKHKLLLNYVVVAALFVVATCVSIGVTQLIREKFLVVVTDPLPSIVASDEMMVNAVWSMKSAYLYLSLDHAKEKEEYFTAKGTFDKRVQELSALIEEYEPEAREQAIRHLDAISTNWNIFVKRVESFINAHDRSMEIKTEELAVLEDSIDLIFAELQELKNQEQKEIIEAQEEANRTAQSGWLILILTASGILVALSVANYWTARSIIAPIHQLQTSALEFGRGNLKHRAATSSEGELKSLAAAFNTMAESIEIQHEMLEQKVAERTAELKAKVGELEQMNQLMVGRELKMVAMKETLAKIKQTEKKNE